MVDQSPIFGLRRDHAPGTASPASAPQVRVPPPAQGRVRRAILLGLNESKRLAPFFNGCHVSNYVVDFEQAGGQNSAPCRVSHWCNPVAPISAGCFFARAAVSVRGLE